MAQNPIAFPEGTFIRSVYTGKIYQITKHFPNGMCNLCLNGIHNENWNARNNPHFERYEEVTLAMTLCLLGN